jgi:hypothetical protein
MRIDRLWTAGPFRGGLAADLPSLLNEQKDAIERISESDLTRANSVWQGVSDGRDMKSEGVSGPSRILYAILLLKGAKPKIAAEFVRSLSKTYASITFSPIKFDQLLRANPFLMTEIEGKPLSSVIAREISCMEDSRLARKIYLEIACRALMAANAHITGRYYDEVEVIDVTKGFDKEVPMKRPYLAASKFLLITSSEDGTLNVMHCPSTKVLSMFISSDPQRVEGVIQIPRDYSVFRSLEERRRWMYKHIIMAQLGCSKAFWLRFNGLLHNMLSATYLKDKQTYIKKADFSGVFPLLASPIASEIYEAEWGRVGSSSHITHIGGFMKDDFWELEILAMGGINKIPPIDASQLWRFHDSSVQSHSSVTEVNFVTLDLDSETIRHIKVRENESYKKAEFDIIMKQGEGTTTQVSNVLATDPPLGTALAITEDRVSAPPAATNDLDSSMSFDRLSAAEQLIYTSVERVVLDKDQELRNAIAAYIMHEGRAKDTETVSDYVNRMFETIDMPGILATHIEGWDTILSAQQKKVIVKQMGIIASEMYIKKFVEGGEAK